MKFHWLSSLYLPHFDVRALAKDLVFYPKYIQIYFTQWFSQFP